MESAPAASTEKEEKFPPGISIRTKTPSEAKAYERHWTKDCPASKCTMSICPSL